MSGETKWPPIVPCITKDVVLEQTKVSVVPKRSALRQPGPHRKPVILH